MNKAQLVAAVNGVVQSYEPKKYEVWTIGVTGDAETRQTEHGNPKDWHQWPADSDEIARSVEADFIKLGMKGGTGGLGKANTVYIF